jgi:hypothetical protein
MRGAAHFNFQQEPLHVLRCIGIEIYKETLCGDCTYFFHFLCSSRF